MLRSALEARWRCARQTLRPLTDAERTFRKLTLRTRLCAGGGRSDRGGLGIEEALQVTTSAGPYTIQVTTQQCAATADLDGDCNVGSTDLLILLVAWGPNPGHPADFDEDGNVGASDLLVLLVGWGPSEYVLEVLARTGP